PSEAAGVLFWVGVVSTIVQGGLMRQLLPRFGSHRLLVAGMSTIALALIGICLVPQGFYLYGTQSLFAFGVGITSPTLRGAIANAVPDNEQGKVSGGSQSLVSLSQIIGPILASSVYDDFGNNASFIFQAILMMGAVFFILGSVKPRPKPPSPVQ
ncbi:MAG: MFS transporter, partial [Halothece sp. Uz-M2-17]|nr:MFS transporter [Halothece sp. Uz-M2-17]